MKDEQRIKVLEEEVKIIKNEVKQVLLDLREQYLNIQNPFNQNMLPGLGSASDVGSPAQREPQPKVEEDSNEAEIKDIKVIEPKAESAVSTKPDIMGTDSPRQQSRDDITFLSSDSATAFEEELDEEPLPRAAIPVNRRRKEQEFSTGNGNKVDLVVIAGLTQWLDQATAKLGKERAEVLVEMAFAMGRLPENLKDALIKMARLSHNESVIGQSIHAGDYLSILAQLDNLLAGSKQQDNALLSILSMMKDSRNG